MKYNCKLCGWTIEGFEGQIDDILKHEKTHE
jgi:rubredoxin